MIDLGKLEQLAKVATPGPWEFKTLPTNPDFHYAASDKIRSGMVCYGSAEDTAFIVAACNSVQELIARVRESERQKVKLAENLRRMTPHISTKEWLEWAEEADEETKMAKLETSKFETGQPILYRDNKRREWHYGIYDQFQSGADYRKHYIISSSTSFVSDDCILPYNNKTKHLIGKVEEYDEWEPSPGDVIFVRDTDTLDWLSRVFVHKVDNGMFVCLRDEEDWFRYTKFGELATCDTWKYAKRFLNYKDVKTL